MIEVIKQLVDALEWCYGGEPVNTAEAIKAGKQAIAELESQEPVAWKVTPRYEDSDGYFDFTDSNETAKELERRGWSITSLYTHPPQRTEQEPVAVRLSNGVIDCLGTAIVPIGALLYAHPPQRTWVGLTEQQRNDIENDFEVFISIHVFDAIEAKLKEKNND